MTAVLLAVATVGACSATTNETVDCNPDNYVCCEYDIGYPLVCRDGKPACTGGRMMSSQQAAIQCQYRPYDSGFRPPDTRSDAPDAAAGDASTVDADAGETASLDSSSG